MKNVQKNLISSFFYTPYLLRIFSFYHQNLFIKSFTVGLIVDCSISGKMDNRVPVYCSFNKEIYDACDVVTALIRAPACPEAVVFAQALGILQVDGRWVRVPTTYHNGENIVTDSLILPESLKNSSCMSVLIFSTILEPLAYTHICDEGVYVQFELPNDTLPTFVGIAGSIAYFINITIQFPTQALHCHFDFRVFGPGSNTLNYKRFDISPVVTLFYLLFTEPNRWPYLQLLRCHIALLSVLIPTLGNLLAIVMILRKLQ